MTGGFDQLERELRAAERRHASPRRPRFRSLMTAVTIGFSAVIAAGVVVIILVSARRGTTPPIGTPTAASTARQQLVENLGILRRQQTKADQSTAEIPIFLRGGFAPPAVPRLGLPKGLLARFGYPTLQVDLVRVVDAPHGQRVSIAPGTYRPSPSSDRRVEALWLNDNHGGTGPNSVPSLLSHGVAGLFQSVNHNADLGVILVPDGVAKIELGPFRVLHNPGLAINPMTGIGRAVSSVRSNLAVFRLHVLTVRDPTVGSGLVGTGVVAQATWLNASGKTIRRTTTKIDIVIPVAGRP